MGFKLLLSLIVLTSFLTPNVLGNDVEENLSFTVAPHHAPSHPLAGAPAPHHHKVGRHHHKPASPPLVHPPSHSPAPVHPPSHSPVPVHPPSHSPAPVHPPSHMPAPVHPPSHSPAPVHPPSHSPAPVHPPSHSPAPVHPPSHSPAPVHLPLPERKLVAVQGVVYCKACKYRGVDTLMGATPLKGAVVLLTCNNTRYKLKANGTSDKNGYFFITPPKTLTTYGAHRCRVTLLRSPTVKCNHPTDLHYGIKGAMLIPTKKPRVPRVAAKPVTFSVFTVGPFAFEPSLKTPCPHESIEG